MLPRISEILWVAWRSDYEVQDIRLYAHKAFPQDPLYYILLFPLYKKI